MLAFGSIESDNKPYINAGQMERAMNSACDDDKKKAFAVSRDGRLIFVSFHCDMAAAARELSARVPLFCSSHDLHRNPEYDRFSNVGFVPADVLLGAGCLLTCSSCGKDILGLNQGEARPLIARKQHAYCNDLCAEESGEAERAERVRRDSFCAQVESLARGAAVRFDDRAPDALAAYILFDPVLEPTRVTLEHSGELAAWVVDGQAEAWREHLNK